MNNIHDLFKMPNMQIYPTMNCNLCCPYCLHGHYHDGKQFEGFLDLPLFRDIMLKAKPTHFTLLGGGEPLIAENLIPFLQEFGEYGHRFSFITNLSTPWPRIEELFTACPIDYYGFVVVSHHFISNITLEEIIRRCHLLREFGVDPYVLYVMAPDQLKRTNEYITRLNNEGFAAQTNPLMGFNLGRNERFPAAYTVDECLEILDMVTGKIDAVNIFGGVFSRGMPCRGGGDLVDWNFWFTEDPEKAAACCNGYSKPIDLRDTFLFTGKQELKTCNMEYCGGAISLNNLNSFPQPYNCRYLYGNLLLSDENFILLPCCYMGIVPGTKTPLYCTHDDDLHKQWNIPQFRRLRSNLASCKPKGLCTQCSKLQMCVFA